MEALFFGVSHSAQPGSVGTMGSAKEADGVLGLSEAKVGLAPAGFGPNNRDRGIVGEPRLPSRMPPHDTAKRPQGREVQSS